MVKFQRYYSTAFSACQEKLTKVYKIFEIFCKGGFSEKRAMRFRKIDPLHFPDLRKKAGETGGKKRGKTKQGAGITKRRRRAERAFAPKKRKESARTSPRRPVLTKNPHLTH